MICVDPNGATNDRRKAPGSIDDTSYEKRTVALNEWRARQEYSIKKKKSELYISMGNKDS